MKYKTLSYLRASGGLVGLAGPGRPGAWERDGRNGSPAAGNEASAGFDSASPNTELGRRGLAELGRRAGGGMLALPLALAGRQASK